MKSAIDPCLFWRWSDSKPSDAAGRSPRAYLGKGVDVLSSFAQATPREAREAACALRQGSDDVADSSVEERGEWWKLTLYWATDTKLFTLSPSLRASDESEDLPHVTRYEYVGTARLWQFPGSIRGTARVLTRGTGRGTARNCIDSGNFDTIPGVRQ